LELAALVPSMVVTKTLAIVPKVPGGVTAVIMVEDTSTTLVAASPPIVTVAPETKLVPTIVMGVPPEGVPELGVTLEIVGPMIVAT
jgi:hypothetical protein